MCLNIFNNLMEQPDPMLWVEPRGKGRSQVKKREGRSQAGRGGAEMGWWGCFYF